MSGESPVRVVKEPVARSDMERAINSLTGMMILCTALFCITLMVCAWIIH